MLWYSIGVKKKEDHDWSEIFDLIASEYGYRFSDIRGMTPREIQAALRSITKRKDSAWRFEAALHGVKLGPILGGSDEPSADRSELTGEQTEMISSTMAHLMARKKAEARSKRV